jgi:hypothetical protein
MLNKKIKIILNKTIKIMIISLAVLSLTANAARLSLTLTPVKATTQNTSVTFGIPFAKSELISTELIKIFDQNGSEIQRFVEPTIFWYDSPGNIGSIRAVRVQVNVPALSSSTDYSFSYGEASTKIPLAKASVKSSWVVSDDPKKAKMMHPSIFVSLSSEYLGESQIIPPFASGVKNDNVFWNEQIKWASDFDYGSSTIANWLFDRPSALYKGCMRTEDVACYQEAFTSYQYWMTSIKRDGDLNSCKGGSLLGGTTKACDTKYTYIEPIKIHLALTGDDTQHDPDLILAMAHLSRDQHYYQAVVDDPYDIQNEPFTERAAGIGLLAQINAYELTGDQSALDSVNKRVDTLFHHQSTNPDGLPADGTWRHSWAKHEGASYPGDDVLDDKRFSPWMTENIIDSLWQVYQSTQDERIKEMITKGSRALIDWGFTTSPGYEEKYGKNLETFANKTWHQGCNTTGDTILYSASSVASLEALLKTQSGDGWYSDVHSAEVIFMLSLGYYFETDIKYKNAIRTRLNSLKEGYLNEACGQVKSTKRLFNWNNRSNYWGTYLWVGTQDDSIFRTVVKTVTETYQSTVSEDFTTDYSASWDRNDIFTPTEQGASVSGKGIQFLSEIDAGPKYEVKQTFTSLSSSTLGLGIVIGQPEGFLSIRTKSGAWGGVYIYKHSSLTDLSGDFVASAATSILLNEIHIITVGVDGLKINIKVDDALILEYEAKTEVGGTSIGILANTISDNMKVKSFTVNYGLIKNLFTFNGTFDVADEENWINDPYWDFVSGKLTPKDLGWFLTSAFHNVNEYSIQSKSILNDMSASMKVGLVFGQSDVYYYSAKIKLGPWGGVFIYKHLKDTSWDVAGEYITYTPLPLEVGLLHELVIKVNGSSFVIFMNNTELATIDAGEVLTAGNVGYVSTDWDIKAIIHNFSATYYQ